MTFIDTHTHMHTHTHARKPCTFARTGGPALPLPAQLRAITVRLVSAGVNAWSSLPS